MLAWLSGTCTDSALLPTTWLLLWVKKVTGGWRDKPEPAALSSTADRCEGRLKHSYVSDTWDTGWHLYLICESIKFWLGPWVTKYCCERFTCRCECAKNNTLKVSEMCFSSCKLFFHCRVHYSRCCINRITSMLLLSKWWEDFQR